MLVLFALSKEALKYRFTPLAYAISFNFSAVSKTTSSFSITQGPAIKITITSTGNVETDLKSEFIMQGINQTLHRVYLDVVCEVSILTPFKNISQSIKNQVLLLENVIIGNIPDSYYNLEGLTDAKDAMELIN